MDDQNKNLILATALSFLVILVWFVLFPPTPPEDTAPGTETPAVATQTPPAEAPQTTAETLSAPADATPAADAPRIAIDTPRLEGSLSLLGGRIDMLNLKDYRETIEPGSPDVTLLRPAGEHEAFYALFGWAPGGDLGDDDVPGANTVWSVEGDAAAALTPSTPLRLVWSNGKGLTFRRTISVDADFMFTVTQSVENASGAPVRLAINNEVVREGLPDNLTRLLVHEGAIRQSGKELEEVSFRGSFLKTSFDELDPDPVWGPHAEVTEVESNGWLGFTDHYWMTVLIPGAADPFRAVVRWNPSTDFYRTVARYPTIEVAPGARHENTSRLFAGAKEWSTIRAYQRDDGIFHFVDSIDWGWYFFLTKPMFALLHFLNSVIGNMGWAIIALTLIVKAVVFPLAYKSYVSMARMKELQPEMEKIKERAGDDRAKLQKEMMELYKKNKVNPASGCLPIFIQIPIFFSLYKVILVTLELRQAAWIGWIRDLSAPDPSSILNLFGLLPFAPPDPGSFLAIFSLGVLPILLGISMWLQQKLNPAPTDPTQQMVFAWMPWIFMFMLGQFASGLVLYWIANNTITFIQQYTIMSMHGKRPDLFGNILSGLKRKKTPSK